MSLNHFKWQFTFFMRSPNDIYGIFKLLYKMRSGGEKETNFFETRDFPLIYHNQKNIALKTIAFFCHHDFDGEKSTHGQKFNGTFSKSISENMCAKQHFKCLTKASNKSPFINYKTICTRERALCIASAQIRAIDKI